MTRPERRLVLVSEPLPECELCEAPTRRDVHDALGGLCTACNEAFHREAGRVSSWALPPAPDTLHVAGQLSIQEPACRWAHGPVPELDPRGLCSVCAEDEE